MPSSLLPVFFPHIFVLLLFSSRVFRVMHGIAEGPAEQEENDEKGGKSAACAGAREELEETVEAI